MQLTQLFKDSAIYSISNILTRAINIFLVPLYTRVLMPSDYGVVELISVTSNLFTLCLSLQITQAIGRFYPGARTREEGVTLASTALVFVLLIYFLFAMGTQGFAYQFWNALIGDESAGQLVIRLALLSIVLSGLLYFFQNQLKWRNEARKHAATSISFSLSTIGFTAYFVLISDMGVTGVFLGMVLGELVGCSLASYLSRSSFSLTFDRKVLASMLSYSVPLIPAALSILILRVFDRFVINSQLTLDDLGVYSIAAKVASILIILLGAVQSSLTPKIFSSYDVEGAAQSMGQAFRIVFVLSLFLAVMLSVFSAEILYVLAPPAYFSASKLIPYLLGSGLLYSLVMFAPGLHIVKKTGRIAYIHMVIGLFAILLSLLLVREYGLIGVATASLVSAGVLFVWRFIESQQYYYIPIVWWRLAYIACIAITMIVSSSYYADILSVGAFGYKGILILLFVFLTYWSGVFTKGELKKMHLGLKGVLQRLIG